MGIRTQWLLVAGFGVTLALVVAFGLAQPASDSTLGQPAPEFTAYRVEKHDTVSLSTYRDQVILLNIWATWCPPCEAEMPAIQKLHEELGPEGLRVLAVSVDEEASSDSVMTWARSHHLTFDILHDASREIENIYRTIGVPESFVIDRQGRVVKRVTGFVLEWDAPAQKALFRRLLADTTRAPARS
ncbi:MAG: TlpA family protein disulfide reductase [Gemmatimonadetes bacterium]|nr:TlpA family protein disulfide reductase [Gemmatimonadota bacterium]